MNRKKLAKEISIEVFSWANNLLTNYVAKYGTVIPAEARDHLREAIKSVAEARFIMTSFGD